MEATFELIIAISAILISGSIHEFAHAWSARKLGDPTALSLGRYTINPFAHIDPILTIVVPIICYATMGIAFGGMKPVPVDTTRFRRPSRDMAIVAIAGPVSNLIQLLVVMGLILACAPLIGPSWLVTSPETPLPGLRMFLFYSLLYNVVFMVFNMIPLPPLDGSRVLRWLLPRDMRTAFDSLERWGILLVMVMVFVFDLSFIRDALNQCAGVMQLLWENYRLGGSAG